MNFIASALCVLTLFSGARAFACAKKVAEHAPKRVVLWQGNLPVLPHNKTIKSLNPGDTVVFGEGTEFLLGESQDTWTSGDPYGRKFRVSPTETLWIPFFAKSPKTLVAFQKRKSQCVCYSSDFGKLYAKLSEFSVNRLKVIRSGEATAGEAPQYYIVENMPEGAIRIRDFLNPKHPAYTIYERTAALTALEAFARTAAPFTEIGLDDVAFHLMYTPERGWFLEEWTSYNQMYQEGETEAPSVFSGALQEDFVFTQAEYDEAEALRTRSPYAKFLPQKILNEEALTLFLRLQKVTSEERERLYGVKNRVSAERRRPLDLH